jgi:carbamate kinase
MIGYLIQQELRSLLRPQRQVAAVLTMVVVGPGDPAFASPTKFVGPVYPREAADKLAAEKGWTFRQDGTAWRRVMPSPEPWQVLEIQPIDKDLASELLAEDVGADLFVMATDVDGVYLDWGTPGQRRLGRVMLPELAGHRFAAGSMGPKVEAAARFAARTGHRAAIGSLADIAQIVAGEAGTNVVAPAADDQAAPGFPDGRHAGRDGVQTGKGGEAGS